MSHLTRNMRLRLDFDAKDQLPPSKTFPKTKMVCTIGPKTKTPEMLGKMIDAGMSVARMNFSHGTHAYHGEVVDNVRAALAADPRRQCGIMLDTKGPEIRTGKLGTETKTVDLVAGQTIEVSVDNTIKGDAKRISLDYKGLCTSVKPGYQILIADGASRRHISRHVCLIGLSLAGLIALSVEAVDAAAGVCQCRVLNTAVLGETKNVHLPGAVVDLPAVSEQDVADLKFGVEKRVDMVAASFIRKADDVRHIRQVLGEKGKDIRIISKIESIEGIQNFDDILTVSDGIMVARGDLGVELPIEQIFIAQKMMISKCNAVAKPVITATQMLESMIQNPKPTRAEATDVANAVLDGTDCVMLSGETASGAYPMEAIRIMRKICQEAEYMDLSSDYPKTFAALLKSTPHQITDDEYAAAYCVRTANDLNADLIITVTHTGHSSRAVVKYRPRVPVICVSADEKVINWLITSKATIPLYVDSIDNKPSSALVDIAFKTARDLGLIRKGSLVVLQSASDTSAGSTQTVKVLSVSE